AVEADLAAEAHLLGGVVELVDRTLRVQGIAAGVAVGADAEEHLAEVLHVAVFIEDEYELGEREPAEAPDRVHRLVGMAGEFLFDRDEGDVVEAGCDWQNHDDY